MSRFEFASLFESSWFYPIYLQTSFSELSWTQHASQENPVGNFNFFWKFKEYWRFYVPRYCISNTFLCRKILRKFNGKLNVLKNTQQYAAWMQEDFCIYIFYILARKKPQEKTDSSSSNWLLKRYFLKKVCRFVS